MSINTATAAIVAHIRGNVYFSETAVYPQNMDMAKQRYRRYIEIIVKSNPRFFGTGGDIRNDYIIILECGYLSSSDPTIDSALEFDNWLHEILRMFQNHGRIVQLQRQGLKISKGITDLRDHPFSPTEPGKFIKFLTLNAYEEFIEKDVGT